MTLVQSTSPTNFFVTTEVVESLSIPPARVSPRVCPKRSPVRQCLQRRSKSRRWKRWKRPEQQGLQRASSSWPQASARPGSPRLTPHDKDFDAHSLLHIVKKFSQSRDVFRQVHPSADLGLYFGKEKMPDADVLFASVQTLSKHLAEFSPGQFDYIVVDEFHHASASSYRKLIEYFQPKFLLGLTATPDRLDGADLLALCDDNLAFECSLVEGIRRGELVPFRYQGLRDLVDFAPIPWKNGKFDLRH